MPRGEYTYLDRIQRPVINNQAVQTSPFFDGEVYRFGAGLGVGEVAGQHFNAIWVLVLQLVQGGAGACYDDQPVGLGLRE